MKKILATAVVAFLSLTVQPAVATPPAQCVVAEGDTAAVATAECAALVAEHQAEYGLINSIICAVLALWFPPNGDIPGLWDCPPYNS